MIKLTLLPSHANGLYPLHWEKIMRIYEHIAIEQMGGCSSLMEYAVRLDKLLTLIEADRYWLVKYEEKRICFWLPSLAYDEGGQFMIIELKSNSI